MFTNYRNLIIHHSTGSDVRTIHESMTRSRSSLLAMTGPFRSQAQIHLPAPGLDNDQTALPPGIRRPVSSNAQPRGLKIVSNARPMPAHPPLLPPPGLYIDTCITLYIIQVRCINLPNYTVCHTCTLYKPT